MTSDPHPGVLVTPEVLAELEALAADAARRGDIDTLERALNAGVAPNTATPRGDSLLMLAASYGQLSTVAVLLARGANPNQTDAKGQAPLAGVAFKGLSTSPLFLVFGIRGVRCRALGRRPHAARHGGGIQPRADGRVAAEHGASPDARDASGLRPIDVATAMGAAEAHRGAVCNATG